MPTKDVTLYDNWRDVVGLKGTGKLRLLGRELLLPEHFSFVWDLLKPKPRRGGASYLLPPFSFVAKEHGSVAVGAARRALDELIKLATTTRGTFRVFEARRTSGRAPADRRSGSENTGGARAHA